MVIQQELKPLKTLGSQFHFYAQDINPDLESGLQNIIDNSVLEVGGISACVILPNGSIWQGVAGNSHEGVSITPDMHFIIASNTKTFISTLVMMQVEEGTLFSFSVMINSKFQKA